MAKYITVAPNGKMVTISHSYGSASFQHGEIIYNDKLAVVFPNLFHKLPEDAIDKVVEPIVDTVQVVTDFVAEVVDAVKEEIETVKENVQDFVEDVKNELLDTPEPPPKKKAGRPAGSKGKKTVKKPTKKKE